MTALFYLGLICAFVLFLVTFAAISQWAEKRSPRLRRFLDRHMPEHDWQRPW